MLDQKDFLPPGINSYLATAFSVSTDTLETCDLVTYERYETGNKQRWLFATVTSLHIFLLGWSVCATYCVKMDHVET